MWYEKLVFFQFKIICLIVNEYIPFFLMKSDIPTGTLEIGAFVMDGTRSKLAHKALKRDTLIQCKFTDIIVTVNF